MITYIITSSNRFMGKFAVGEVCFTRTCSTQSLDYLRQAYIVDLEDEWATSWPIWPFLRLKKVRDSVAFFKE